MSNTVFIGKSNTIHNPINVLALATGNFMGSRIYNFLRRNQFCPDINKYAFLFEIFYKGIYKPHGINFDNLGNAYMLDTFKDIILKIPANSPINTQPSVFVDTNLRFPVGTSFDKTFTYFYPTNFGDPPNISKVTRVTTATGEIQNIIFPDGSDSLIQMANGCAVVNPDPSTTILYVCSFGNNSIVKVLLGGPDGLTGTATVFAQNLGGPVFIRADPYGGAFSNPSSFLVSCQKNSTIIRLYLDGTSTVIIDRTQGILLPSYIQPNSDNAAELKYYIISNSNYADRGEIADLVKIDAITNQRMPFIPACVLNYYLENVKGLKIYNNYLYISSQNNYTVYRINMDYLNYLY